MRYRLLGMLLMLTVSQQGVKAASMISTYDTLHRLTRVDYDNGASITYTYDVAGNRLSLSAQAASAPPDRTAPVILITQPTTGRLYVTTSNSVVISGTASDDFGITAISCTNGVGIQAAVSGTTSWMADAVPLSNGINRITVSASDTGGNVGRASLTVVVLPPDAGSNVIFQDDFNDNSIDATQWQTSGYSVNETGQIMQVLCAWPSDHLDQWGILTSQPIAIQPTGTITITRNVMLHYANNYFGGNTYLRFGNLAVVGIRYYNMDYSAPPNYMPMHGFYICRNNATPINPNYAGYDPNDVSSWISPVWDTWFKETIAYDPQSGDLAYSINDVLQTTFNVGVMPPTNAPSLVLTFDPGGWWTGHQHLFDDLLVTQSQLASDPTQRDSDGDGMPDWAEFLAGTCPTNPASRLTLQSGQPAHDQVGSFTLEWSSSPGIFYSVNRATNLLDSPNCFAPLRTNIPGLPGTTTYTDTNPPAFGPSFYRINVEY